GDPQVPGPGAAKRQGHAPALADDRAPKPQGMDGAAANRWSLSRRLLARAPDSDQRHRDQQRASESAREVDAQLRTRRALRQSGPAQPGVEVIASQGDAA